MQASLALDAIPGNPLARYAFPVVLVCAVHAGLLAVLWPGAPAEVADPQVLAVVMISAPAEAPAPPAPKPEPVKPRIEPKPLPRPPKPLPMPEPPRPVESAQPAPPPEAAVPAATAPVPAPTPPRVAVQSTGPSLRGGLVKPRYPTASLRDREEGSVEVSLFVRPDGSVGQVVLKKSSGFWRLDEAAVSQAKRWKLNPARQGDEAVGAWLDIRVPFKLE